MLPKQDLFSVFCTLLIIAPRLGSCSIPELVKRMSSVVDLGEVDGDTWKEDPHFRESVRLTFPPRSINCYTFTHDASLFSERMFILFQESNVIPPIAIDDEDNELGCRGFFIIANTLKNFKEILTRLPRWSTHRLYCLIRRTNVPEITHMLKNEVELFADAEAALFIYGDWSSGFRLGQPVREFERITDFNEATSWEVKLEGYRQFYGREVRFSTTNCSIYSVVDDDGNLDKFRGIDWKVFLEMSRRMNLTLKYVKPLSGTRIGQLVNGTWKGGIIGNVYSGLADIAFCGNWIESSKMNTGIQLSVPVQRMCINYLVPRPKRSLGNWYAIFTPFSGSLWVLLGVTLVFVTCVLNLMSLKMKFFLNYRAEFYESRSNALLSMFGILVQGSWPNSKGQQGPARHIVTGWVIFGLLMTTSFSSTLVSHLAKPKFDKKPEGIKDLVEMGYTWTENSYFPLDRLLNMEDVSVQKWARKLILIHSPEERMEDLKNRNRVIIGSDIGLFAPFGAHTIPEYILNLYETMDGCIALLYSGFIYRSGAPFNDDFDFYLRQLRESGIILKFVRESISNEIARKPWIARLKMSIAAMSIDLQPLSMTELKGVFEMLAIGHAVSSGIFLSEFLVHRFFKTDARNEIKFTSGLQLYEFTS